MCMCALYALRYGRIYVYVYVYGRVGCLLILLEGEASRVIQSPGGFFYIVFESVCGGFYIYN